MTKCKEIYNFLNLYAPVEEQEDFDNAGFLFGDIDQEVERVLLALDATSEVIEEAAEIGAGLIVTHHPVIFHGIKRVFPSDPTGKKILQLAQNHICVISMHTNLDKAAEGVNDVLIRKLGVSEAFIPQECTFIRYGELDEQLTLAEFLHRTKTVLHTNGLRYTDSGRPVKKIACLGGAGGDELEAVVHLGCDTFVTADVKYNVFLDAKEYGINLIDADHFCTENPVIFKLQELLTEQFPDSKFTVSRKLCQTVQFF